MSNSKIARIVRDIEYRQPAGALPEYKYGIKVKRSVAPEAGEPSETLVEPNYKSLKEELSRAPKRVTIPNEELVGLDG